jgi:ATP-dependent RNA helicase DeaD
VSKKTKQLTEIFYTLCNDFGFTSPSMLQQQIPEFVVGNKLGVGNKYNNSIIESSEKDGTVIAGLLLLLLRNQIRNQEKSRTSSYSGPELLLVTDQPSLKLLENSSISGSAKKANYPSISIIGMQKNAGDDLQKLRTEPWLLAVTPDRLIDHLRRDNINLRKVVELVIIRPDSTAYPDMRDEEFSENLLSFNRDLQYIFSKFKKKPKISIFSPKPEQDTSLIELMTRPKIINRADWSPQMKILQIGTFPTLYPELIADIVLSQQLSGHILVFCDTPAVKNVVQWEIERNSRYFTGSAFLLTESLTNVPKSGTIIFYGLHDSNGIQQIIPFIANNPQRYTYMCLTISHKTTICQMLEEHFTMKNTLNEKPKSELITAGKIKMLLEKIRSDKNPEELQEFRKLIKKTVPFTMRRYLAAYLLRDTIGSLPVTSSKTTGTANRSGQTTATTDGSSLFISIGKSRRVYPKDLSKLLQESAGLESSEILSIKILDNYSFITVSEERAAQAIEKINGTKFRGRTITCDFARKKG